MTVALVVQRENRLWVALVTASACGGEHAAPQPAPPLPPPQPVVVELRRPQPPVPLERVVVDPAAEAFLRDHLDASAKPMLEASPPKVTALALEHTALSEARGLDRDGAPKTADLATGERASMPLPLATGDCVTVLAHGGIGVAEVDTFLVVAEPGELKVLSQDTRRGPLAILGGQRGCAVHLGAPAPNAELWVQVREGSGPVVVGVYRAVLKPR
jgi:hypothetical protein